MKGMMSFLHLFPAIGPRKHAPPQSPEGISHSRMTATGSSGCIVLIPIATDRRVMIKVFSEMGPTHLATINHAFDPPAIDDPVRGQTFLDPLNVQSLWPPALLDLFKEVVLDEAYRKRLERHDCLVKDGLHDPSHPIHQIVKKVRRSSAPRHKG